MATPKKKTEDPKPSTALQVASASAFPAIATQEDVKLIVDTLSDMSVSLFQIPRMRVPSGSSPAVWSVVTDKGEEAVKERDVIILATRKSLKAWWIEEFGDGEVGPPDCSSSDGITGHGINSEDEDAEAGAHDCINCPWNQFKSTRGGGDGKDCKDFAQILVITKEGFMPTLLKVPTMSLKPMTAYYMALLDRRKRPEHVITRLTLNKVKGSPDYYTIAFASVGDVPPESAANIKALSEVLKTQLFSVPARTAAQGGI